MDVNTRRSGGHVHATTEINILVLLHIVGRIIVLHTRIPQKKMGRSFQVVPGRNQLRNLGLGSNGNGAMVKLSNTNEFWPTEESATEEPSPKVCKFLWIDNNGYL